ncbi:MAG: hypothetical protein HOW59_29595 [Nonomuraea sp.]|nr:hypothetical protein [Nonomuraea sp.]NUS89406.1 hypothetical protein [Streptomyces sp.]
MKRSHAIRDHEEGACAARALAFMARGTDREQELLAQARQEDDLAAAARNGTYPEELDD